MSFAEVQVLIEENRELLRGPKGVKGDRGEPGRDGTRGETGPIGRAGKSITGPPGRDGRDGKDGVDGKSITGPAGKIGPPGKDGVGPDERVRVSQDDPKAGFLADKLTAGSGIEIRTAGGKRGERLVIDAKPQGGGGGGQSGIIAYDDGVAVGAGNKVSFDGGDPVTIAGGIIRVPVGSGAGGGFIPQGGPFTEDFDAGGFLLKNLGTPADLDDAARLGDVATLLESIGLSQVLGVSNEAGNNPITLLADPTDPQDAATKAYVDAAAGGSDLAVADEGVQLTAAAASIDFVGAVTATAVGTAVTVTVPGATTGDLDAVLTAGNDGGALDMTNVGSILGVDNSGNFGSVLSIGDADSDEGGTVSAFGGMSAGGHSGASVDAGGGHDGNNEGGTVAGIGGLSTAGNFGGSFRATGGNDSGLEGGSATISGGTGATGADGGSVGIVGGTAPDGNGGDIYITGGAGSDDDGEIVATGLAFTFNGDPVLVASTVQTYTETNVTTDRAFNANSMTLDEIADVLGSLIADLRAIGVVA